MPPTFSYFFKNYFISFFIFLKNKKKHGFGHLKEREKKIKKFMQKHTQKALFGIKASME